MPLPSPWEQPLDRLLEDVTQGRLMGPAGCSAAVAGALAAALVSMIACDQRSTWTEAGGAAAQAEVLHRRLSALAVGNSDAHARARDLLDQADTPAEPADADLVVSARDHALADALAEAAIVPLGIAEAAADVCALAAWAAAAGLLATRPDALAAVCLAEAAASAAAGLVLVNLSVRAGDALAVRAQTAADAARRVRAQAPLTIGS